MDGNGIRIATARAGNVIGGGDWAKDRLIPDLIRACISGSPLKIRNPDSIRPWQHVLEPLSGYLLLGQHLWDDDSIADAWNFGPGAAGETSVRSLAERASAYWNILRIETDEAIHLYEAATLRLDASKAITRLGWHPVWDIDTMLGKTINWYQNFQEFNRIDSTKDLTTYIADARRLGLEWAV